MSKRLEKISKIDEQIAKLENQRKLEAQKQREEERKTKNQRHCKRGVIMEKALPELITITDEQFNIFVEKVLVTNHTKKVLAELTVQNHATPTDENSDQAKSKSQSQEQANSETVSGANHS